MNKLLSIFLLRSSLCAILITVATVVNAQNLTLDSILTQQVEPCYKVSFNARTLLPHYYERGSYDSLLAVADYWYRHCERSEPLLRLRILLAIWNNSLNEDIYGTSIIDYLLLYKNLVENNADYYSFNLHVREGYYPSYEIMDGVHDGTAEAYNAFTLALAKKLAERHSTSPLVEFFLRFYSHDFTNAFHLLQSPSLAATKIRRSYDDYIEHNSNISAVQVECITGLWFPQNKLATVGSHPTLGIRFGSVGKYYYFSFTALGRFLNSANNYQVFEKGRLWNTEQYLGGYFGFDGGYRIVGFGKHHILALAGIAYDGFDALDEKDEGGMRFALPSVQSISMLV